MTALATHRTEPVIPRRLLSDQSIFAVLAWAGFTVFMFALTLFVSLFREIDVSGWNIAGQPARWFGFAIGAYVGYALFPLYVTHGGTRKGFTTQILTFVLGYGILLGVLFTLTFPIEAGYYAIMGWPQALHAPQLYSSALDLPIVLAQWVLIMMLWVAGGVFLGGAWYRDLTYGSFAILIGIFLAGISGMVIGSGDGPFEWVYHQFVTGTRPEIGVAISVHLTAIAIFLGLCWLVFKDAPIHNKSS